MLPVSRKRSCQLKAEPRSWGVCIPAVFSGGEDVDSGIPCEVAASAYAVHDAAAGDVGRVDIAVDVSFDRRVHGAAPKVIIDYCGVHFM